MKKTGAITLTSLFMLLGGCAITNPSNNIIQINNNEPLLVGKPVSQRLSETTEEINNQLFLLEKVQQGGRVGTYSMLTHNNNLDARFNSSRTIPKEPKKIESTLTNIVAQTSSKVKKIDWENNSLNLLAGNFAKALGYEFVIQKGVIADKNINFNAENITVVEAIDKLKMQVAPFAELLVVPNNKTVNLLYRK